MTKGGGVRKRGGGAMNSNRETPKRLGFLPGTFDHNSSPTPINAHLGYERCDLCITAADKCFKSL